MTQEITNLLQNIFSQEPNLLISFCNLNILSWKSKTMEKAFILQIGRNRYISHERKDRNGETYWKFKLLTHEKTPGEPKTPPSESSDQVKKFQERMIKTQSLNKS